MNIFFYFETAFQIIIDKLSDDNLLPKDLDVSRVVFELPREASHGDIATNAAMVLAKQVGSSPRDIAMLLADELKAIDGVRDVKIAGPGFLNIVVEQSFGLMKLPIFYLLVYPTGKVKLALANQ